MIRKSKQNTRAEQVSFSEAYNKIVDRAYTEIEGVREVYKWLAGVLGIIAVVGIAVISYLSFANINEMKIEMLKEVELLTNRTEKSIEQLKNGVSLDLKKITFDVEKEVRSRIDNEFNRSNIQDLVRREASLRIDKFADQIIIERINKDINPLLMNLEKELSILEEKIVKIENDSKTNIKSTANKLSKLITDTRLELDEIQEISGFFITMISALNNDRNEWEKLDIISKDSNHPFSAVAGQAYDKIKNDHSMPIGSAQFIPEVPWIKDANLSEFTFEDAVNVHKEFTWHIHRLALIKYVWEKSVLSEKEKMSFLIYIIKSDKHLDVVEYAGRIFAKATKLNIKPLATDYFIRWWDNNNDKFK